VTTLIPATFEANAFTKGHDLKNVVNGTVQGGIFKEQVGLFMLADRGDGVFYGFLNQRSLPVVFGTSGEQKSTPESEEAGHDCKYKKMVEIQWALLSILIGCIVGDYFGRLYTLRYRSDYTEEILYSASYGQFYRIPLDTEGSANLKHLRSSSHLPHAH